MNGRRITKVDLNGKCGSCKYAHYTVIRYPCSIVCEKMSPMNNLFNRSRKGCPLYELDQDKICECGETIECWYNFCPTCGCKVQWKGSSDIDAKENFPPTQANEYNGGDRQ